MTAGRDFPWRWLISCIAISVVALTILMPPPGSGDEGDSRRSPAPPDTAARSQVMEPTVPDTARVDTVRVMVLNGTDIDGLAGRTQRLLLRSSSASTVILAPFDPSDAPDKPYEETIVISHIPDLSPAAVIAGILELSEDCIVWEVPASGGSPEVDVTVCLGEDLGGNITGSE